MTRLNGSSRQQIGYVYLPKRSRDITIQPTVRNTSKVEQDMFEKDMEGYGMDQPNSSIGRDSVREQVSKIQFGSGFGSGLNLAGISGSGLSLAGSGLSLAGGMYMPGIIGNGVHNKPVGKEIDSRSLANAKQKLMGNNRNVFTNPPGSGPGLGPGSGLKLAGSGFKLAGMGFDEEIVLPGQDLKKSLLKKLKKKKSGLVKRPNRASPGILQGVMRDKTLEDTSDHELDQDTFVGGGRGRGREMEGGFILLALSSIIAAISAAAASAMATTVVGSVTVGTLAGAAATGAATAAGKILVEEIMKGKGNKDIKKQVIKAIKETVITIQDLPSKDKIILQKAYEQLKKDPTQKGVIELGKKIAPIARKVIKEKVVKKLEQAGQGSVDRLSGSGLKLAGQGLSLAGAGAKKKFDFHFIKDLTKNLIKKK